MKLKEPLLLFLWFVVLMMVWSFVGTLVSAKSTISVLVGLLLMVGFIVLTYYSKFFTKFFKK